MLGVAQLFFEKNFSLPSIKNPVSSIQHHASGTIKVRMGKEDQ
jgi:hypothetical protein